MSWRLLIVTLLVVLGASAWGGLQLGDWLVAHAPPAAPAAPAADDISQQAVLDANGKPYVAQPPQPRIDGTLGVPDNKVDHQWAVNTVSLFESVEDPHVLISRSRLTSAEAREIAAAAITTLPAGTSDISTLDISGTDTQSNVIPSGQTQMQTNAAMLPGQIATPAVTAAGWQEALRRDLAHCATQGFFQRPSCSWAARNKYCEPNNAWGTITECPRRP